MAAIGTTDVNVRNAFEGRLVSGKDNEPRRVRVERNIYRRPTGVLEVGFKDASGIQRWRTVDGGRHGGPQAP